MAKKSNAEKTEQQTVMLFADRPVKYNGKRYYNVAFDADTDTANELIREGVCKIHVESVSLEDERVADPSANNTGA